MPSNPLIGLGSAAVCPQYHRGPALEITLKPVPLTIVTTPRRSENGGSFWSRCAGTATITHRGRYFSLILFSGELHVHLSQAGAGHIFLVGSADAAHRLGAALQADSWVCTQFETPSGVLRRIRDSATVDLVALLPNESLHAQAELCRDIKFDSRTGFLAVVFVLRPEQARDRTRAYEAGADDCVMLPASDREIQIRLSNILRVKRATDLLEDSTAVITSLANAIEGRDAYTHGHVERVSTYSAEIGKRVDVNARELAALKTGGIVHDIGKVAVPDAVLNKPGKLEAGEMALMQRHPVIGFDILQPLRTFRDVLPIVRCARFATSCRLSAGTTNDQTERVTPTD